MLVDTDVVIWNLRGNIRAAQVLDGTPGFSISAVTYMELVQGMRDKTELQVLRRGIRLWGCEIIAIDSDISLRAMYLMENFALSHNLQLADALIAATALSTGLPLMTANDKHYRFIDELALRVFRP